jgi:hypothetical protein
MSLQFQLHNFQLPIVPRITRRLPTMDWRVAVGLCAILLARLLCVTLCVVGEWKKKIYTLSLTVDQLKK